MSSIQSKIFKYRSYTPVPFLIIMLLFGHPNIYSIIAGLIVAVSGELIRLWGVSYAGSETRTTGPVGGTYLVISGPFAHTRNPLYVGNILLYMGIGIMSMALFPYLQIAAFIFFYLQYKFIINEEEGYLKKTFGEQYEEYYRNVPRFVPRVTAYQNNNVTQPKYNVAAGLKSERRTLQAFSIVSLTIIIIWFVSRY